MQSVLRYEKHGRAQVAANSYRTEVSHYNSLCEARLGQFVLGTDRHAPMLPIMWKTSMLAIFSLAKEGGFSGAGCWL